MTEVTKDFFYDGKVTVYQGKRGFRFSVDAPILADFIPEHSNPDSSGLEIGSGCGIISLLLLYKQKLKQIECIEIQEPLASLSKKNAEANGFNERLRVFNKDFSNWFSEKRETGIYDAIFTNPPYYQLGRGKISRDPETAVAKFELKINLKTILAGSAPLLKPSASLFMILPADRLKEIDELALPLGLTQRRIRMVHSRESGKAERFLVQLCNCRGDSQTAQTLPPLYIYKDKGIYSDEMDRILKG